MIQSQINAYGVMRDFYNEGFKTLRKHYTNRVGGFFFSDCGVLFARDGTPDERATRLLEVVAKINRKMLKHDIMLISSIAFGHFRYIPLTEHEDIEKMGLFGEGYLKAYINAEVEKPKMSPGQCRIAIEGLNSNYENFFEENRLCYKRESFDLPTIDLGYENKYYYYYWMIKENSSNPFNKCREFEVDYTDCYKFNKEHKYINMKKVLKKTYKQNFEAQ